MSKAKTTKQEKVTFSCLICKKKQTGVLISPKTRDSNDRVVKCSVCGHTQLESIPSAPELHAFYDLGKQGGNIGVPTTIPELWARQKVDTDRRVAFMRSGLRKGARVLDIGSGYGFYIREMEKAGFDATGIEISDVARNISKKVTRAKVYDLDLADSETDLVALGKFSRITLFHVVEHIPHPVEFLARLKSLLAPGGELIIEVPNVDDHLLALSPAYQDFYYQHAHCSYYGKKTLGQVLREAGYIKPTFTFVQRYSIDNMMQWHLTGKPQITTPAFSTTIPLLVALEKQYKEKLCALGQTDTLIVRTSSR
jgi:2-polyprenyl-3-methyl-5-hydroxy-6-metoxy-1,4-benzoquinol methylase/DNA-directed RNA polymerase subunit RPC12/RpoP